MSENLFVSRLSSLLLSLCLLALCAAPCMAQKKKKKSRARTPTIQQRTELIAEVDELESAVWERFTSAEGQFSILFPGVPEEKTQVQEVQGGKITGHLFQLINTHAFFQVWLMDFPVRVDAPEKVKAMLDALRTDTLDKNPGQLLSESDVTIEGHPGKYIAWRTERGMLMKAKYLLSGNRTYTLLLGMQEDWDSGRPDVTPEQSREIIATKFFDSFKLSSRPK